MDGTGAGAGAGVDLNVLILAELVCFGGEGMCWEGAGAGSGVAHASLEPHASMLFIPEKFDIVEA